jgi:Planctomycete extracellular
MNLLQFSDHGIGSNRRLHPVFTIAFARHRNDGSTSRRRQGRHLLVEDLEGRQLLSGIRGNHIGYEMIQANHVAQVQKVREALPEGIGILKCPE